VVSRVVRRVSTSIGAGKLRANSLDINCTQVGPGAGVEVVQVFLDDFLETSGRPTAELFGPHIAALDWTTSRRVPQAGADLLAQHTAATMRSGSRSSAEGNYESADAVPIRELTYAEVVLTPLSSRKRPTVIDRDRPRGIPPPVRLRWSM